MQTGQRQLEVTPVHKAVTGTVMPVLLAISFSHLLNDMIQSLIPAIYPLLKSTFGLSFSQIGLIQLAYQFTASLLQPMVGWYTDYKPKPYSLAIGMAFTLSGLVLLSRANSFGLILISVGLVGVGSSIFHPEASRVARAASGGRYGFAQSLFQVGGNAGTSVGPLLAALVIVPLGQSSIAWFALMALLAIVVLALVGGWCKRSRSDLNGKSRFKEDGNQPMLPVGKVILAMSVLIILMFSKYFYLASIRSYFTFYLIGKFHLPLQAAQLYLFVFLGAIAIGTLIGGPFGDRFGRKYVIWGSIVGTTPFALLLPLADLFWTGILTVLIGLILSSALSAIVVYAQELVPGRVGLIGGLFFGLAFGLGGVGSAVLGCLADHTSIDYVFRVCSFLPLIGLLTAFLPNLKGKEVER